MASRYIGRFAPSPTGPLHFGSLVAALGACLQARSQAGEYLLRIEDVDAPRTVPGAATMIMRQLERFGFSWDGDVIWQSQRVDRYRAALDSLIVRGSVFPCVCSRKEIADSTLTRDGSRRYPGTCRDGLIATRSARAWRVRTEPGDIAFSDAIQGECHEDVFDDVGDFVVMRADGQFAYQLAVVVDDAEQGVTHVVRGADLLDSTPRQIFLQRLLGYMTPEYAHLPVAINASGEKLSKQTLAAPLDENNPVVALHAALVFLGQAPPSALMRASVNEVWTWAQAHWRLDRVPKQRTQTIA
ncbi:MAG TPA: tRNA glutamyl-Q(34) synthetase GluQRS [Rhodocyclaceae bacterium]|nr:tRNA glutamyl-Q(34) synthetase GluQRS [Rhodocyclaceae bacterium]